MSEQPQSSAPQETGAGQPPVEVSASSARLVATLAVSGAVAGLLIVMVFQWANPRIEEYRAMVLAEAVTEVLGGADHYETVFLEDGRFTLAPLSDTVNLERVYVGYDELGQPVGVAVAGGEPGFQDIIDLIFGYDPGTGDVLGMKVLESKETPGLGDKILKDSTFIREFIGVATPLVGVKKGRAADLEEEVIMITGATISSRAVIDIINHQVEALGPAIGDFWSTSAVAARAASASTDTVGDRVGGGG
jgi:electron transport complex protein RnfG